MSLPHTIFQISFGYTIVLDIWVTLEIVMWCVTCIFLCPFGVIFSIKGWHVWELLVILWVCLSSFIFVSANWVQFILLYFSKWLLCGNFVFFGESVFTPLVCLIAASQSLLWFRNVKFQNKYWKYCYANDSSFKTLKKQIQNCFALVLSNIIPTALLVLFLKKKGKQTKMDIVLLESKCFHLLFNKFIGQSSYSHVKFLFQIYTNSVKRIVNRNLGLLL